ncbi:MAG: NAD-dependent epimerase/dehydratase family protein [Gemmobacter sp.]
MPILITGGGGFVMSNLALLWLQRHPGDRAVLLDTGPQDDALRRFLAPVADRVTHVQASVLDTAALDRIGAEAGIDRIVHGATISLSARRTHDGQEVADVERDAPGTILEVNFMGTVRVLDLARRIGGLKSFVNVSSGAVYNDFGPDYPGPLPEDGWVHPPEFYGIAKQAAERAVARYARLFGFPATSVRPSGVYGPMDRYRPTRVHYCPPYAAVHAALAGRVARVCGLDAVGDHIHAQDVCGGIIALLERDGFAHPVYNLAQGSAVTLRGLLEAVRAAVPGFRWVEVAPAEAEIAMDPRWTGGRWGAYDISRLTAETGWRPRPLAQGIADYAAFVRDFGATA